MNIGFANARSALLTGCVLFAVSSSAEGDLLSTTPGIHVFPRSGNLGNGFEYRLPINEGASIRVEQQSLIGRQHGSSGPAQYQASAELHSRGLIFEWRPFAGAFHANVGIFVNDYRGSLSGATAGRYALSEFVDPASVAMSSSDIDRLVAKVRTMDLALADDLSARLARAGGSAQLAFDATTALDETLRTTQLDTAGALSVRNTVRWNRVSPYVGMRWSNAWQPQPGFVYHVDIGAMYVGKPSVDLRFRGSLTDALDDYDPTALSRYAAEQESRIREKLAQNRVVPVISLGVGYRF